MRRFSWLLLILVAAVAARALPPAQPAQALGFTVVNLTDCNFANCGSLRDAITQANANPGIDTISFQAGVTGTITLTSALPAITGPLILTGPGANLLTIDASCGACGSAISTNSQFAIAGLTVSGAPGTGIDFTAGAGSTINDAAVIGNRNGGINVAGQASVTINRSLFANNSTVGSGGGIRNLGTVVVNNSTIYGNNAGTGGGVASLGGAVGAVTLNNVTISANSANTGFNGGGGILAQPNTQPTVRMQNTIVWGNVGGDCATNVGSTPPVSAGNNLIGDVSCGAPQPGDLPNTNPNFFGNLNNNGGSTATRALQRPSPAIDAGNNAAPSCTATDQRGAGFPRVVDGDNNGSAICDIGAFELQALLPPTITKSFSPTTIQVNGLTTLSVTVTNPNNIAVTGAAFTDPLPTNVTTTGTSAGANVNVCAGATTVPQSMSWSGFTIPASSSCTFTLTNITSAVAGSYPNTTSLVTSTNAPTSLLPGTATLTVTAAPVAPTAVPTTAPPPPPPPIVIPFVPQVFQHVPQGILYGNKSTPTPVVRAAVAAVVDPGAMPALRPPNTGDAGLKTERGPGYWPLLATSAIVLFSAGLAWKLRTR